MPLAPTGADAGSAPGGNLPGGSRGAAAWTVSRRLFDRDDCCAFDFFQAVRLLGRLDASRVAVGFAGPPGKEVVRFRAHISLSFPPSSIYELEKSKA